MSIEDFYKFLDIIDCPLEITRYANQQGRHTASIRNCDVKIDILLSTSYGNGKSPHEAVLDYIKNIAGKTIVINAGSKDYRKEFRVPE